VSLPILDPKKLPADWEVDIFGIARPPTTRTWVSQSFGDLEIITDYGQVLRDALDYDQRQRDKLLDDKWRLEIKPPPHANSRWGIHDWLKTVTT